MIQILFLIKSILAIRQQRRVTGKRYSVLGDYFHKKPIFISVSAFYQRVFIKMWKLVHGPHFNYSWVRLHTAAVYEAREMEKNRMLLKFGHDFNYGGFMPKI